MTIRLGNLYVALVTLTFGLLFDDLVFTQQHLLQLRDRGERHPALVRLEPARLYVPGSRCLRHRRAVDPEPAESTAGLALNAVRWSPVGARTMGISVLQMKVLVSGIAAFVAGIGGAMYALSLGTALPTNYSSLVGLVWLAILVTLGIRSNMAALMAGVSYTVLAGYRPGLPARRLRGGHAHPLRAGRRSGGQVPERGHDRERAPGPLGLGQGAGRVANQPVPAPGPQPWSGGTGVTP